MASPAMAGTAARCFLSGTTLQPAMVFGGDFRVVRALRAGGMGAVYVVDQISTGKQRALKVLSAELEGDPATRERFVLEARAASAVDSDHVVEIVTAGIDAATGAPFLVMELLRGEALDDACERLGPLPLGDVAEVLSQLGHALELAHAQGIVHRDLKPENIFLSASRRRDVAFTAKILDFGIAKLVEGSHRTGTQPLGTPLYMPPEQTEHKGKISPASDVWAMGLIVFRLLTGIPFWKEAGGSLGALLREIVIEPIPSASERAAELGVGDRLPPGFDAWFARCVAREVDARFQEAGEAVRAFMALVPADAPRGALDGSPARTGGLPVPTPWHETADPLGATAARPDPAPLEATGSSPAKPETTGPDSTNMEAPKPDSALAVIPKPFKAGPAIGVAVLVALLGVGGLLAFRGRGDPSAIPSSSSLPVASSAPLAPPREPGCPEGMVLIPGASAVLGSRELAKEANSKPTHEVTLSSFCLDRTEVTTRAYGACVEKDGCERALDHVSWPDIDPASKKQFSAFCNTSRPDRAEHPVNCVAWTMADRYCKKRGAHLPTEAEWEYAARGPKQRRYPWGDEAPTPRHLNVCGKECVAWARKMSIAGLSSLFGDVRDDDGFPGTSPVGSFPAGASAHGVLDLAGNVYEWTADWYAPYTEDPAKDPKGPEKGTERVARGGGFFSTDPAWINPAWRYKTDPDTYNHAIGFRCALTP